MSVRVRPYKRGSGWHVDIRLLLPDGTKYRERKKAPNESKSAAKKWGEDRERHLLRHGPPPDQREVPSLKEFAERFLHEYARANRQKPSGIAAKETILRIHLVPLLGAKRLDEITTADVQQLKARLGHRAPKTVNNVLTVLNVLLRKAVEWNVIDRMPCSTRMVRVPKSSMGFYDYDDYERLVEAAAKVPTAHLIVLLGGEAGLRCGEMIGLEWQDVDLQRRQICVQRSDWKGHVSMPKGGRLRYVRLTTRLTTALREDRQHCQLRSRRVLCRDDGSPLSADVVKHHVERAARRAQLVVHSGVHRLRHTFCSHLAMEGAPARAIQELAGHQNLATTERYMHISPAAIDSAIQLLERRGRQTACGNMLETADRGSAISNV